jgi:hypothetical protein
MDYRYLFESIYVPKKTATVQQKNISFSSYIAPSTHNLMSIDFSKNSSYPLPLSNQNTRSIENLDNLINSNNPNCDCVKLQLFQKKVQILDEFFFHA